VSGNSELTGFINIPQLREWFVSSPLIRRF